MSKSKKRDAEKAWMERAIKAEADRDAALLVLRRLGKESMPEFWSTKEALAGFVRMLASEAILKAREEA